MEKSLFFYDLPPQLIAQHPLSPRDSSRLLCLDRESGAIAHHAQFASITDLLFEDDLLVINDSKVFPARLIGEKEGSGRTVEVLLLRDLSNHCWETLVYPGKQLKVGARIRFPGDIFGEIVSVTEGGKRVVRFSGEEGDAFFSWLDTVGTTPLPHYIEETLSDTSDYQTVYAKHVGSAAAPTAGFHFTLPLMEKLKEKGIRFCPITLHIGLGTFRPVREENIENHLMHEEYYSISEESADLLKETKRKQGRILAVGTTACRTLESVLKKHGDYISCKESTDLFIYPGYTFRAIDGLITNFHLPESTLIMLVSAFAGHAHTMHAYREAVSNGYRFYSFGDAMFIV